MKSTSPLDNHEIRLSSRSLKSITDEMLFLELARRGYNVTSRRENETTAEIVKIG